MYLQTYHIDKDSFVRDIVSNDYRTADVFRRYDIDFCCGGKWPLEIACANQGVKTDIVLKDLKKITNHTPLNAVLEFDDWDLDFLADYIVNVHHRYLRRALPEMQAYIRTFLEGHSKKFPDLAELEELIEKFIKEIPPHMAQEEEILFPYIRQIFHAWKNRESYARLLIRTLRKPVEEVMQKDHISTGKTLHRLREITKNYMPQANACLAHKVTFAKLKELDAELVQHIHLENNILFPKAIAMEKELLTEE